MVILFSKFIKIYEQIIHNFFLNNQSLSILYLNEDFMIIIMI